MNDDSLAPVPSGGRVPAARYWSAAFAALEWERVFTRTWLFATHEGSVAQPGDFITFELGDESVLIARGDDGRVRAFYNVCQHRGNLLCAASQGRAKAFRCAYHHWCYRNDGLLIHVPGGEAFAGGNPERRAGLAELRCEVRFGLVWVSMNPEPESIDVFLAPVAASIAPYHPERYALMNETVVEVPCNWKTSVDVNNEAYHIRALHPQLLEVVDDTQIREEVLGDHSRITIPLGVATKGSVWEGKVGAGMREFMRSMGLDPASFSGTAGEVRPALVEAVRRQAALEGVELSALSDEALVEKRQVHVFPNVQLNFTARTLQIYRHRPHGADPCKTLFDDMFLQLLPASEPRRSVSRRRLKLGEASLGPVMDADVNLLPDLQRGARSRGFAGMLLGPREEGIANMHAALDRHIFSTKAR